MHAKAAPAISTATLPPQDVYLVPNNPASIKCPWCGKWLKLKRRMLPVHQDFAVFNENETQRADGHNNRCDGSAQRFELEPIKDWIHRFQTGASEVAPRRAGAFGPMGRRQGRVMAKPALPVPIPVCRPQPASGSKAPSLPCNCAQCRYQRRLRTA